MQCCGVLCVSDAVLLPHGVCALTLAWLCSHLGCKLKRCLDSALGTRCGSSSYGSEHLCPRQDVLCRQ